MMPHYYFEDFTVGRTFESAPYPVSREALVGFAAEFDPQPFHLDEEAAVDSFFGGLVASGWHTTAITMRLVSDTFIHHSSGMGSPGIDEIRWIRPVRAGDVLMMKARVLNARESKSRPDIGLVEFHFDIFNQKGETVMTQKNWIMFGKRAAPAKGDGDGYVF
ncbi:MAG: MaoC family dehydratase [Beijerinckiaceae bacterium]